MEKGKRDNVLTAVCSVSILSASLGRHAAVLTGEGAQAHGFLCASEKMKMPKSVSHSFSFIYLIYFTPESVTVSSFVGRH